jgi:general secretion pathway protein D
MKLGKFIISVLLTLNISLAQEEMVELNFVNTPIENLTTLISDVLGVNFVSDTEIRGNFTFVSQKPIKKNNLMDIYKMILKSKGYMLVNHEDKGFFMIVRNNDPQRENIEFNLKKENYEVQTEIINLKYFKPSKVNPIITPYFTQSGRVVANDELGFIMLTDYYDNIQKIKKIVKRIDIPANLKIHWVKLENINTAKVFAQVTKLTQSISQKYRKTIQVLEDKSTNAIIILAEGNEYRDVEAVIQRMDREARKVIKSEVVYLKNSKAADVLKIIQTIADNRYKNGELKDSEKVSISSDVSLNAIILLGDRNMLGEYKNIISELDKPKKQVYVEARIIEINEDKSKEIGVNFDNLLAGNASSGGAWSVVGNINKAGYGTAGMPALGTLGATGAAIDQVTGGISLGATLNLLQSKGVSKVLSSPKLLCLDNQESSIYVGKVAPVITSESQATDTTSIPVTNYSYKDIGLTLKIKPQIMSDNKVRLDITNKLEEIISGADESHPTTTKREINTTSIVKNGDSVIIAGLIKDKKDVVKSKVPLLGDIPFLGAMFRGESVNKERVNLIVILTPTVVTDVTQLPGTSNIIKDKLIPNGEYKKFFKDGTTIDDVEDDVEEEKKDK